MEFCDMCNVVAPLVYVRPTGVVWGEVANGVTMAQAMVLMLNKYGPITVSINVPNNFQTLMNYG